MELKLNPISIVCIWTPFGIRICLQYFQLIKSFATIEDIFIFEFALRDNMALNNWDVRSKEETKKETSKSMAFTIRVTMSCSVGFAMLVSFIASAYLSHFEVS
eukprot:450782_1